MSDVNWAADEYDEQTELLMPIAVKYEQRIIEHGIKPYCDNIVEDIRKIWIKSQEVPMTFISRMTSQKYPIDYWEPSWDGSITSGISIALLQRLLTVKGLTEQLQVYEALDRDNDGKRTGVESVIIAWYCRYDSLAIRCEIKRGKGKRYLDAPEHCDDITMFNPIMWPWNTNEDIADFFKLPPEEFATNFASHPVSDLFNRSK